MEYRQIVPALVLTEKIAYDRFSEDYREIVPALV